MEHPEIRQYEALKKVARLLGKEVDQRGNLWRTATEIEFNEKFFPIEFDKSSGLPSVSEIHLVREITISILTGAEKEVPGRYLASKPGVYDYLSSSVRPVPLMMAASGYFIWQHSVRDALPFSSVKAAMAGRIEKAMQFEDWEAVNRDLHRGGDTKMEFLEHVVDTSGFIIGDDCIFAKAGEPSVLINTQHDVVQSGRVPTVVATLERDGMCLENAFAPKVEWVRKGRLFSFMERQAYMQLCQAMTAVHPDWEPHGDFPKLSDDMMERHKNGVLHHYTGVFRFEHALNMRLAELATNERTQRTWRNAVSQRHYGSATFRPQDDHDSLHRMIEVALKEFGDDLGGVVERDGWHLPVHPLEVLAMRRDAALGYLKEPELSGPGM